MVTSWPSDGDAVPLLALGVLAGVGTLVVLAALEVRLGVLGARARREGVGVERAADAERDLVGGDGLAVLPRGVVTDGEGPLRVVVVGRAQVGGEVGDQQRLTVLVAGVLGQRAARERLLDRVARDGPPASRVERVGTGVAGQVDRDGAAGGRALDVCGGALALSVLAAALLGTEGPVRSSAAGATVVRRPAATGSEGQQRGTSNERKRLVPLHAVQPFYLGLTEDGVSGDVQSTRLSVGSWGPGRRGSRRPRG